MCGLYSGTQADHGNDSASLPTVLLNWPSSRCCGRVMRNAQRPGDGTGRFGGASVELKRPLLSESAEGRTGRLGQGEGCYGAMQGCEERALPVYQYQNVGGNWEGTNHGGRAWGMGG